MKRSDWLTVALQVYGMYLVVSAILSVTNLYQIFDVMGFGDAFGALLKIGFTAAVGAALFWFAPVIGNFRSEPAAGPNAT